MNKKAYVVYSRNESPVIYIGNDEEGCYLKLSDKFLEIGNFNVEYHEGNKVDVKDELDEILKQTGKDPQEFSKTARRIYEEFKEITMGRSKDIPSKPSEYRKYFVWSGLGAIAIAEALYTRDIWLSLLFIPGFYYGYKGYKLRKEYKKTENEVNKLLKEEGIALEIDTFNPFDKTISLKLGSKR